MKKMVLFIMVLTTISAVAQRDSIGHAYHNYNSFGMQVGTGWSFAQGQAGKQLRQGRFFLPSMLVNIQQWRLMVSGVLMEADMARDIQYRPEYQQGNALDAFGYELSLGQVVYPNKYINIVPMFGVGGIQFSTNPDGLFTPRHRTAHYGIYSLKLAIDRYLFTATSKNDDAISHIMARAMIGYYPNLYRHPFEWSGGATFLTVGVGMQFGAIKNHQRLLEERVR